MLGDRSTNDFPSALSEDELHRTSKMAESQTGPPQMLRQKPHGRGKHFSNLITARGKLIRPHDIHVEGQLGSPTHQYTNQAPEDVRKG